MSDPLAPYASWYNANSPIFVKIPAQVSTLAVSSLTGNILTVNSTFSCNIQSTRAETSNQVVSSSISLNNQILTATSSSLLFNGTPLASQGDLSNWSYYPQTSTLQGNNQNIRGTNLLEAKLVNTSTLTGSNGTFINLFTQNLMAFNVVTFTSTFIDVYESTIQSDIKLANISTLNARDAYVSSATISSLNAISASIYSLTGTSANFSNLSVNSNTTTGSLNVLGGATISNGANFPQGFGTSGQANFNNQTICNLQTVSNSNTTLSLIVDASTNTSTYPTINIQSKFGGGGQVNITADSPSIFVGVPSQAVNITAKGGVGYLTGIPVGGAINLVANAGTSNSITPTGVLANGAIKLTAYSFINGAFTVPGLIQESAGSITAYAGLTSPTLGVYGCAFYSALTCLSLTCGASPATTSFPGVVYLRGDNGTKVVNGFYADSINNNAGYDLNIASKTIDISNRNINIDSGFDLKLNSSNGGQVYINGSLYPPASGSGVWCSTATTRLNMNGFNISNIGNLYSAGNFNIYAPAGSNVGFNNNVYFNTYNLNDIGGITMVSGGNINLSGGNLSNVGNIFGSNLTVSTGGNLTLKSSTGGNVVISNNLDICNNNVSNIGYLNFPSGGARGIVLNSNPIDMGNGPIYNASQLYNNNTNLNLTGIGRNITLETFSGGTIYLNNSGANIQLNTDGSIYLQTTGANKTVYLNTESLYFTGSSNNNINGLGHIYGNTSAPGGGLGIDYVYGLFFNSAGNNANLFCSGGNLQSYNYNGGTYIHTYNTTGTGNLSFYSDSNEIYIVTGRSNISLNSGSNIYLNAIGSDGVIALYASTVNSYSLLDTNIIAQRNLTLRADAPGGSITSITSTITLQANTINLTGFVGVGSAYSLNMNTAPITSCGAFSRRLIGTDVAQPILQYSTATGTGNNGTVTVNLPQRYTSQTSYIPFANIMDDPPAQIFVSSISRGSFIIGWSSGGSGTHTFGWNTMGT